MTYRSWLVGALVLGAGALTARGCLQRNAPDEKLAGYLAATCQIMHDNLDTPKRGVDQLGSYLARHTGDITGAFGDMLATIETIRDDRAHDERAMLASDRLRAVTHACEQDWFDFNDAVMADPAAAETLDRGIGRLVRTLQILIDGSPRGAHVLTPGELRALPDQLDHVLDELTTRH